MGAATIPDAPLKEEENDDEGATSSSILKEREERQHREYLKTFSEEGVQHGLAWEVVVCRVGQFFLPMKLSPTA